MSFMNEAEKNGCHSNDALTAQLEKGNSQQQICKIQVIAISQDFYSGLLLILLLNLVYFILVQYQLRRKTSLADSGLQYLSC